jgi:hypothetical protein
VKNNKNKESLNFLLNLFCYLADCDYNSVIRLYDNISLACCYIQLKMLSKNEEKLWCFAK